MGKKIMRRLSVLIVLFFLSACSAEPAEDEIVLIPDGYVGEVSLVFGVSNGLPKEYENGKRIYRVSKEGYLFSRFQRSIGKRWVTYYYVDAQGNRVKQLVGHETRKNLPEDPNVLEVIGGSGLSSFGDEYGWFTREFDVGRITDLVSQWDLCQSRVRREIAARKLLAEQGIAMPENFSDCKFYEQWPDRLEQLKRQQSKPQPQKITPQPQEQK